MGRGWRRAFCTTIPRNRELVENNKLPEEQENQQQKQSFDQNLKPSPSPRSSSKFGFLSISSNPSTPRLQSNSPKLQCKRNTTTELPPNGNLNSPKLYRNTSMRTATTPKSCINTQGKFHSSNPSSPRTPLSILKNTLRLSKNSCGVCMQSLKINQGMAIYTAECSHTFHFPCIAEHSRNQTNLLCPVCKSSWKDVPLLMNHKLHYQHIPSKTNQETVPITKKCDFKTYNDDEPLTSPKLNPIPQSIEIVEDEDVQEFQGFFVNSTPKSDEFGASLYTLKEFRNIEVSLLPEAAIVAAGPTHQTLALILKVKAPSPPAPTSAHNSIPPAHFSELARRAPVDLVAVLDVSGSMSGAKLQMLKRAMRLVISSLGSADRLSIVAFSATPKRLMSFRKMNAQGQRTARQIIDRLGCSQGSSVGEALKIAANILQDRREKNPVASIILLSDGPDEKLQPNNNETQRQRSCQESTTRFSHIEIPVHSSGFGRKFRSSSEPDEDAFSKCVGGLLSVVVQDLRIQVDVASGSDPAEIAAIYSCNSRPAFLGSGYIRVGDLYAEEEREFLVELRVPISSTGSHHILSVKCSYKDPGTQEQISSMENNLLVPKPQTFRSNLPRNERLRNLFVFTRALAESRRLMELNELTTAAHLLSSALGLVMQSKCESAEEFSRGLEVKLAEVQWVRQEMILRQRINDQQANVFLDENGEPFTPTSAQRTGDKLGKVAVLKRSVSRICDLHGFENARF